VNKLLKYRRLSLVITMTVASMALTTSIHAMRWFRNGDRIVGTGGVSSDDPDMLQAIIDEARKQGIVLRTVVIRNSGGGSADGGYNTGEVIRNAGLGTVLEGGCYSACADMFMGGVSRRYGANDLPTYSFFDNVGTLGIHGDSGGGDESSGSQQEYLDYYRRMLSGQRDGYSSAMITLAHYHANAATGGFLYYFDPTKPSLGTRLCPTYDTSVNACTSYPDHDAYKDGLINQRDRPVANDVLVVNRTVRGNLNPGMDLSLFDGEDLHPAGDLQETAAAIVKNNTYGVIAIAQGGNWLADQDTQIPLLWINGGLAGVAKGYKLSLSDLVLNSGGRMNVAGDVIIEKTNTVGAGSAIFLQGGLLGEGTGTLQTWVLAQGFLGGYGTSTGSVEVRKDGVFAPHGLLIQPYALRNERETLIPIVTSSEIDLGAGAVALFSVSAEQKQPGLILEEHENISDRGRFIYDYRRKVDRATLGIDSKAKLALEIAAGYYPGGQENLLVSSVINHTTLAKPDSLCSRILTTCEHFDDVIHKHYPFIKGQFTQAYRLTEPTDVVDLTQPDATISARKNSLLNFRVVQTEDKISLMANPSFDDVSLFTKDPAENGFGIALRSASHKPGTALAPLLGALQFADRDAVKNQAGALRGDAYASTQSDDVAMSRQFGNALAQHLQNRRSGQDEQASALVGSMLTPLSNRHGFTDSMTSMARYLVNDPSMQSDATSASYSDVQLWGRGFGNVGRIDPQGDLTGMHENSSGILLGADHALADGKFMFGGSLGFGTMSARAVDKRFRNDTEAFDLGLYANGNYSKGYVSATLRYTSLDHNATRYINHIEGLTGAYKAKDRNHTLSARVEHGLEFTTKQGTVWQPLLPVIDYVRWSGPRFTESGGPAALVSRGRDFQSLRGGLGLRIWHSFSTRHSGVLTPHAQLLASHEFKDRQARMQSSFVSEPEFAFDVPGQNTGTNSVAWNLGIGSQANKHTSILLDYIGESSRGRIDHGFMLGLTHNF
jgi:outer membrane autotransporter protein